MTEKSILSIQRKLPCSIGTHLNGRSQKNSTEACDLSVRELMLEPAELDALCGPGTHKALFTKSREFAEPSEFVKRSKMPFELEGKFKNSRIVLFLGPEEAEVELDDCTLAHVRLKPKAGGLTQVDVQVQATPDDESVAPLFRNMSKSAACKIRFGKLERKVVEDQDDLPLDDTKNGAGGDDPDASND